MPPTPPSNQKRKAEDAADTLQSKKSKSEYKDVITVVVGQANDTETFAVHKDLLCTNSPFFQKACSKTWSEATDKTVRLPEQFPLLFKVYTEWLYTENNLLELLHAAIADNAGTPNAANDERGAQSMTIENLCAAWLLGDYLVDIRFKNAVMTSLSDAAAKNFSICASVSRYIFTVTTSECVLRKFLVDYLADTIGPDKVEVYCTKAGDAVRMALLKELVVRRAASPVKKQKRDPSKYHENA